MERNQENMHAEAYTHGKPMEVNVLELYPFYMHPFQVKRDAAMDALVEDVRKNGIIQRIIVRPRKTGGYEIISGHRRTEAAKILGMRTVPVEVREDLRSNDDAASIMVQSNFQSRRQFLPSEMARALKILHNIYSRRREIAGEDESRVPTRHTKDLLAEHTNISPRQVHRYLRLSELSPDLLELVDANKLKMNAAQELSYLGVQEQGWVLDFYEENNFLPNGAKAKKLRAAFERYELSEELLEEIMNEDTECASSSKPKSTFYDRLREEFYPGLYDSDIEEVLWDLAEAHRHRMRMEW